MVLRNNRFIHCKYTNKSRAEPNLFEFCRAKVYRTQSNIRISRGKTKYLSFAKRKHMESLRNALYWFSRLYEHLACTPSLAADIKAATHGMVHTYALHGEIFCRHPVFVNDNVGNAAGPGTAMYLY